jgi:hypothetical protein
MENELNRAAIEALVAQMSIDEGNLTPCIDNALTKAIDMHVSRLQEGGKPGRYIIPVVVVTGNGIVTGNGSGNITNINVQGNGNNVVVNGTISTAKDIGKALDILHEQLKVKDEQIDRLVDLLQKR